MDLLCISQGQATVKVSPRRDLPTLSPCTMRSFNESLAYYSSHCPLGECMDASLVRYTVEHIPVKWIVYFPLKFPAAELPQKG